MDTALIDKLVELTGEDKDQISEKLDGLSLNEIYELIDLAANGDDQALLARMGTQKDNVEEAMSKNKKPTSGKLPKPRDPMAKALALPQYQHKVAPGKKEKLDKMQTKHKGRVEESILEEGVMGMTGMPALQRMLELAGRPVNDEDLEKAMEDMFSVPTEKLPDFGQFGIEQVPTGTKLTPGLVTLDKEDDLSDLSDLEVELTPEPSAELGAEFDDFMNQNTALVSEPEDEPAVDATPLTSIQVIRDAAENIRTNLPQVAVGEFSEVRHMLSDLMSQIDRLANQITGK